MLEYCRLYVGQHQSPQRLAQQLSDFGYRRVEVVADPGEFALRGGIADLFPATFESPLRLELDGARVSSIRSYNPRTLDTLDHHTMVVVLPRRVHTRLSVAVEVPFEAFVDLRAGGYIVHMDHGVGRYLGRAQLEGPRGPQDALVVEYAGGDRLYVPMEQMHLVQTYVAFGRKAPALHTLGGTAWPKAKARAYVGAWMYAKTMLELEARRRALPGTAFAPDHDWQRPFEASFPYRETPDQLAATVEVKRDMERDRPMDRLLLGDVGYGKTEVALRAAFKAVMGHKQVAILVPTTILAYQHHRTLTARLSRFPVQAEMLTRLVPDVRQREILLALTEGRCDIVVGTQRLLSPDVRFKDLGLLIVDEEQRFGLRAKERLKQWRTQMDVLTLSATPIPRTLYLALVGARDLSLIATPPEHRHPVATRLVEEDDADVRRWILEELNRGGQVYVVHNQVRSVYQRASHLARLVPEARIGVAHGQMADEELEQVMVAFIEGRLDVLVTTTIIESGIDIPNANTLIVERAETFGLADLYQLRGRVGRFDRKAFAYLVASRRGPLTREARTRLTTIVEHSALGSGFKIAMEDLKIRGAGNLLGVEQSGHVSAVGFDLYCRLLRDAVSRIRQGDVTPPENGGDGPAGARGWPPVAARGAATPLDRRCDGQKQRPPLGAAGARPGVPPEAGRRAGPPPARGDAAPSPDTPEAAWRVTEAP
jgi:transcription-repair coupling factor (superfamily II helicase)